MIVEALVIETIYFLSTKIWVIKNTILPSERNLILDFPFNPEEPQKRVDLSPAPQPKDFFDTSNEMFASVLRMF